MTTPYGMPGNSERADGQPRCINAQPGSFNHECGAVATWIGDAPNGHRSCFCDSCKYHGHEARYVVAWERIGVVA